MPTLKILGKIILADVLMVAALMLVHLIIPISSSSRLLNIPLILVYTIIGGGVYFFVCHKFGLIKEVLGERFLNRFKRKRK